MTIRNMAHYKNGTWDWGILSGCFGKTKIKVSDIDGMVERNGHVLLLEAKFPDSEIPKAQLQSYMALVRLGCSVIFIWGDDDQPEKLRVINSASDTTYEPANLGTLRALVSSWFKWADSQGRQFTSNEDNPF